MDSLLKRVIAQRDLEQEQAIVALPVAELVARHCEECDVPLNMTEDLERDRSRHFCNHHGGWRADARRNAEIEQLARRRAHVNSLLELVQVPPLSQEAPMAEETRVCPGCGKALRSDNRKGVCSKCFSKGARADTPAPHRPLKNGHLSVRKKFRVVAEALGIDGEQLLEQFMSGWLAKIRGSVRPPEEEDIL